MNNAAEKVKSQQAFDSKQGVSEALEFLSALDPTGAFNLTAFDANGTPSAINFAPGVKRNARITSWLQQHFYTHDIYYHVAAPAMGAPNKKLSKADLGELRALHVDIDPRQGFGREEERARLRKIADDFANQAKTGETGAPAFVIDSGGGFQAIWKLREKLEATPDNIAQVEALNLALVQKFGGDRGTQNADRLMRLPGTINHARGKKKQGRPPRQATLVSLETACVTSIADALKVYGLPKPDASHASSAINSSVGGYPGQAELTKKFQAHFDRELSVDHYDDLRASLRERFDTLCQSKPKLAQLIDEGRDAIAEIKRGDVSANFGNVETGETTRTEDGDHENDATGNGWRLRVASYVLRSGKFTAEEYALIMWTLDAGRLQEIADAQSEWHAARQAARDWLHIECKENEKTAEQANDNEPEKKKTKKPKLSFVMFDDEAATAFAEPESPLVEDMLDEGAMIVLYGDSNAGKSFVALRLSHAIATGTPFAGKKTKQGLVVYIVAEGGRRFGRRVAALRKKFPEHENVPVALIKAGVDLHAGTDVPEILRIVREAEAQTRKSCALVVVDTLARTMGTGSENDDRDMKAIVGNGDRIRSEIGAALLYIHHSGKDKAKGARGWSGLRAATDTELEATKPKGSMAGDLEVTKQRDMETGAKFGFRLVDMDLGTDQNGKARKAAYAEMLDAAAPGSRPTLPNGPKLSQTEQEFLRIAETLIRHTAEADGVDASTAQVRVTDIGAAMNAERLACGEKTVGASFPRKMRDALRDRHKLLRDGSEAGFVRLRSGDKSAAFEAVEDEDE
jgi:hypothetical protein